MSDFKIVKLLDPISISLTGPSFTGEYNNGTTYQVGQSVSYFGSSYVALAVTTGNLPTDTSFWQLLAEKGDAGGDNLSALCRNITGVTIPKRSVVYITGASGARPTIALAQADSQETSDTTLGITSQDITNASNGTVVFFGALSKVDTSAFAEGDKLYLSPTIAGGITTTKPVSPYHAVGLGVVTFASSGNGSIEVNIETGFHLIDLHDVSITSVQNEDVLEYQTSTGLWRNVNKNTFESVSKNLKSNPYQLNYTSGVLTSIVYTIGPGSITKTLNYTGSLLTSIVLSGDTPSGIDLTKTLGYTSGNLTSVTYS